MSKRYFAVNILILILCFALVATGFAFIFLSQCPTDLKQQTGYIMRFNQYDEKWYDWFLGSSNGSCFNVRLGDDSYYEATGICYDNIHRSLFEKLRVGESITITYFEKSGGVRKICAVEYMGETYLSLDDVLNEFDREEKIDHLIGMIIIAFSLLVGIILFIINTKKNHWR